MKARLLASMKSRGRRFLIWCASLPGLMDVVGKRVPVVGACLQLTRRVAANPALPGRHVECAQVAEMLFLAEAMRQRAIRTVIDVGANRGQFAKAVRKAGFDGEIVSLEPDPETARALRAEASRDPLWRVLEVAAGDSDGQETLWRFDDSTFNSTHAPSESGKARFVELRQKCEQGRVRMARLDTLHDVGDLGQCRPPILLKSDTQGGDLAVLIGSERFLGLCEVLVVELSLRPVYEAAPTGWKVWSHLAKRGFRLASVHPVANDRQTNELIELDGIFVRIATVAARQAT